MVRIKLMSVDTSDEFVMPIVKISNRRDGVKHDLDEQPRHDDESRRDSVNLADQVTIEE